MYSTCAKINYIINSCVVNGAINCLEYPMLVTGRLDAALHKDTVKAHKQCEMVHRKAQSTGSGF